ncbi:MAG: dTDP-4-dehydrorhamnose 3,5-epimerase [Planctomycetota bacterium]|jgi:dTDP-4-dehydrorhamnose 3,5-epimerase
MIEVTKTELEGVLTIKPSVFEDHRGQYIETYNEKLYIDNGIEVKFVQDDISVSTKGVLRGLHGDDETWKLISCLYGEFYFIVLDYNEKSKNYGKWLYFNLSDTNRLQVLVPPKYANAHLVLSDTAIFHYKQSTYYEQTKQFTVKWNDPRFNISWPIDSPILSKRDQ